MKDTNFFFKKAVNQKKSIFSKGHDAKFFWGINYCSTGKNDPNEPWFGRVYELVYLNPMGIDVKEKC